MELPEDRIAAVYLIALLRPDHVYIVPDSNKLYKLNAEGNDLEVHEIDSLWNMTDEEVNEAVQKKFQ